ncbi:unnamed protein product [Brassica napus]|uniref:(rape) hypothetical protein n=1 Tax=Brassica napus TaxID=3708 RepID=A0A816YYP7_BRANA|nr:unnamed protein product [Brassica napus]
MATTDLFTDVELITTGTGGFSRDSWKALLPASIEKALFVHGEPLTRRPDPEARGLDICRTIFPDKIYYAINVHAWPPSNLTGRCAYSGEDNSSTTFVFYSSSGSISSIFDNHLPLSTACFAWSGVDEQASEEFTGQSTQTVSISITLLFRGENLTTISSSIGKR